MSIIVENVSILEELDQFYSDKFSYRKTDLRIKQLKFFSCGSINFHIVPDRRLGGFEMSHADFLNENSFCASEIDSVYSVLGFSEDGCFIKGYDVLFEDVILIHKRNEMEVLIFGNIAGKAIQERRFFAETSLWRLIAKDSIFAGKSAF